MKDVWETCKFNNDIISSDFSKAKFAVELHEFLDGTADRTYLDPKEFFDNTFLTDQMNLLVRDVLTRLSSGSGQPVTVIDTGFGGGKTHSLLLLHHILSNRDAGMKFVRDKGIMFDIDGIPQTQIVGIDCRKITKKTLWGEIAHRLGRYAEFEEADTRREPPMDITGIKQLFDGPVLLMLDELPHYLLKADSIQVGKKTLSEITIPFVMELIGAVAASQRACLILTLTENQSLYETYSENIRTKMKKKLSDFNVDEMGERLTEAISRQANVMTPVNPSQIYDVVKARLTRHVNETERDEVIREYASYYEKHGMDATEMLGKMAKSYPFHPSLIDILYSRVSTIGKFNQTRGMLRLLARIVRQGVEEKPACTMIGTGEIRFDNTEIRDELTVRLDLNLGTVMDVDCVEHANESDRTRRVSVAGPVAATVMLFSLHGGTKKTGIRRADIKMSVGRPGLDPSLVDKALEDITGNFWYVHDVGGQEFYFDEFPNMVAIIHDHKKSVTGDEIRTEIEHALNGLLPSGDFRPVLWDPDGVTEDDSLKMFVARYDDDFSGYDGDSYVRNMLDRHGGGIRTNKNTIAVVHADPNTVQVLMNDAKTLAAIKRAKKDERVKADRQFVKEIAGRETDAVAQLKSDCLTTYSNVMYPHGTHIRRSEVRFGESKKTTITEAVAELLENQGKLVRDIGPDGLEVGDEPVNITKVYESFAQDMSKPFIPDRQSIGEAIRKGLAVRKFGHCSDIQEDDGGYIAEYTEDFDWGGFLVSGAMVREHKPPPPPPPGGNLGGVQTGSTRPKLDNTSHKYTLRPDGVDEIYRFVRKITTLNLDDNWKSSTKSFEATLISGDTRLTITSSMSDNQLLKGVLDSISDQSPELLSATITVTTNSDLTKFFKEYDLEEYVK